MTVRSRGVIEKCSFCVQRLQEGKLKKESRRPLNTGNDGQWDLIFCQQACLLTIVFGNINDSKSAVVKTRMENQKESSVLLNWHTLPNVSYIIRCVIKLEGIKSLAVTMKDLLRYKSATQQQVKQRF